MQADLTGARLQPSHGEGYVAAGGVKPSKSPARPKLLDGHEDWRRERFIRHRGNADFPARTYCRREPGTQPGARCSGPIILPLNPPHPRRVLLQQSFPPTRRKHLNAKRTK